MRLETKFGSVELNSTTKVNLRDDMEIETFPQKNEENEIMRTLGVKNYEPQTKGVNIKIYPNGENKKNEEGWETQDKKEPPYIIIRTETEKETNPLTQKKERKLYISLFGINVINAKIKY